MTESSSTRATLTVGPLSSHRRGKVAFSYLTTADGFLSCASTYRAVTYCAEQQLPFAAAVGFTHVEDSVELVVEVHRQELQIHCKTASNDS